MKRRSQKRRLVVAIEPLETRTLFNGADGPIVINGTDGPDKIELYYGQLADWNWTWNYNVNGVGKGLYDFDASNVVINGKGGDDKITLFSLPFAPVAINGGAGDDQIELPGVRTVFDTKIDGGTGTNTLRAGMDKNTSVEVYDPRFLDTYDVTSSTLARSWYDTVLGLTHHGPPISYANLQSVTFQTSPGDVKVNVHSTAANCVTTILGGAGKNVFNVGDGNFDTNLLGQIKMLGQGGSDTLNFNDLLDGGDDTYNFNAANLSKAFTGGAGGGADFYDIENINLTANGGNNTININAVSSFATVNVYGAGGDDRFYIGARNYAGNISGKVIVNGGSGTNNQVQFNDQDDLGADTYTLGNGLFSKTGQKYATTFSNVQLASIAGNMDANIFDLTPSSTMRIVAYGRGQGLGGAGGAGGGDVLRLHVDNVTSPTKTTTLSTIGYFSFGNRLPVSFNSIEQTSLVGTPITLTTLRINAGGGAFTDSQKRAWSADTGFSGGAAKIDNVAIAGTSDDALFASRRVGGVGANMTFSAAVKNGTYTVRLLFADTVFTAAGKRVFDVYAEDARVIAGLDIVKEAGPKAALVKTLKVTVTDGKLDLAFKGIVDNATISAIEITPALLS
jgi:hypothetical protein